LDRGTAEKSNEITAIPQLWNARPQRRHGHDRRHEDARKRLRPRSWSVAAITAEREGQQPHCSLNIQEAFEQGIDNNLPVLDHEH